MDELTSDREKVSVKPVLLVAAMLVAAVLGAVVTLRPATRAPQQPRRPSVGVAVIEAPRTHLARSRNVYDRAYAPQTPQRPEQPPSSKALPDTSWA